MAVTAIWDIKGRVDALLRYASNPEKTENKDFLASLHAIRNVVEYSADSLKTEKRMYVSSLNCDAEYAAKQFQMTKAHWNKPDGIVAYHGYQSFQKGEVDAQTAHRIGVKLAERLWGERFEVVVATHLNTDHYHNHFVINSVSYRDGKKYNDCRSSYRLMQQESDKLCREFGLSVVTPKGCGKHYAEWSAEHLGKPTIRSQIRADMDAAISLSATWRDFERILADRGYQLKLCSENGTALKYPGIRPEGAKGYFRLHKLGRAYEPETIKARILRNRLPEEYSPPPKRQVRYKGNYKKRRKLSGLRTMYYHYCYRLHILQRHTSAKRVSFSMRQDVTRLERLDAQLRFLIRNRIDTAEQLSGHREKAVEQVFSLYAERNTLRSELKRTQRKGDEAHEEELKKQISEISLRLKTLRKEVKLCDEIQEHSARIRDSFTKEVPEHEQRRDRRSGRENDAERD